MYDYITNISTKNKLIRESDTHEHCYIAPPPTGIRPEFRIELFCTGGRGLPVVSGGNAGEGWIVVNPGSMPMLQKA